MWRAASALAREQSNDSARSSLSQLEIGGKLTPSFSYHILLYSPSIASECCGHKIHLSGRRTLDPPPVARGAAVLGLYTINQAKGEDEKRKRKLHQVFVSCRGFANSGTGEQWLPWRMDEIALHKPYFQNSAERAHGQPGERSTPSSPLPPILIN